MRDISKAFGIAISDARRKCGLRQVDLAEELGKTNRCISDLENGKTMPRLDTVAQFARRLGISIDCRSALWASYRRCLPGRPRRWRPAWTCPP